MQLRGFKFCSICFTFGMSPFQALKLVVTVCSDEDLGQLLVRVNWIHMTVTRLLFRPTWSPPVEDTLSSSWSWRLKIKSLKFTILFKSSVFVSVGPNYCCKPRSLPPQGCPLSCLSRQTVTTHRSVYSLFWAKYAIHVFDVFVKPSPQDREIFVQSNLYFLRHYVSSD